MELTGSKWVGGLLYLDRNLQLGQQNLMIIQLSKESLGLCTCTSKKLAVETKQLQRRSHPPTPTAQRQPCRQMDKAEPPRGQRPKVWEEFPQGSSCQGADQGMYSLPGKGVFAPPVLPQDLISAVAHTCSTSLSSF